MGHVGTLRLVPWRPPQAQRGRRPCHRCLPDDLGLHEDQGQVCPHRVWLEVDDRAVEFTRPHPRGTPEVWQQPLQGDREVGGVQATTLLTSERHAYTRYTYGRSIHTV